MISLLMSLTYPSLEICLSNEIYKSFLKGRIKISIKVFNENIEIPKKNKSEMFQKTLHVRLNV